MKDEYKNSNKNIGVLITNLGTPNSPTKRDLKKYLNQFLMDKRVIDLPRFFWIPILKFIILNIRPKKSAKLYKKIWTEDGSPLMVFSKNIVSKLTVDPDKNITILLGMRYGSPSIENALKTFKEKNISKILVLPLYPQAGSPTTSSTFDVVNEHLKESHWMPNLRFISGYHDHDKYINALMENIEQSFKKNGIPDLLLFSFHGMPQRYLEKGDPYYCFCHKTARLVSEGLDLDDKSYEVAFQSRFGSEKWLEPYIDRLLIEKAKNGLEHVQIISPGFSVDCLETLEEINIQYRELFIENGGKQFEYIPCLNDTDIHINLIKTMIDENIQNW